VTASATQVTHSATAELSKDAAFAISQKAVDRLGTKQEDYLVHDAYKSGKLENGSWVFYYRCRPKTSPPPLGCDFHIFIDSRTGEDLYLSSE
jgi:hypothetical protein